MWIRKNDQGVIEGNALCEQLDEKGAPLPGQIEVPDDDPNLAAYIDRIGNPPHRPGLRQAAADATDFADFQRRLAGSA